MQVRKRRRTGIVVKGTYSSNNRVLQTRSNVLIEDYMEDIVGNFPNDNAMFSTKTRLKVGVINASIPQTNTNGKFLYWIVYKNFPYRNQGFTASTTPVPSSWPGLPTDSQAAVQVASRTNPSKPSVDLPLLAFELKDFPEMIRQTGISLLKRERPTHVRNNLNNEFGWAPLIGDLIKLLEFSKLVDSRVNTLKSLHEGKSISRTQTVFQDAMSVVTNDIVLESEFGRLVIGRRTTTTKVKKWASIKWIPTLTPPELDYDIYKDATSLVLGLRLRPRLLWDAMPWTWLFDWYTNVGDFLQATDNSYATIANACVMTSYVRVDTVVPTSASPQIVRGLTVGSKRFEQKARVANVPITLTANAPFLGARELSILFQLANNYKK